MLLTGCLFAFLSSCLGAVPIFFVRRVSNSLQSMLLGFSSGVMLSASFFSLLAPSLDRFHLRWPESPLSAAIGVALSLLAGALAVHIFHEFLPHGHADDRKEGRMNEHVSRAWLITFAIALHNLPEGLAVGVGVSGTSTSEAFRLMTGIALQNLPEGLLVALAVTSTGATRGPAFLLTVLAGTVEVLGVLLGSMAVSLSTAVLPGALGFCAGAMIHVVSHELIPESHRLGFHRRATAGLLLGIALMPILDAAIQASGLLP